MYAASVAIVRLSSIAHGQSDPFECFGQALANMDAAVGWAR